MLFRNLRYSHRQAAGIRPQENVNLILSQKLEYVLPGKADLTVIVIPNQPDRPVLPVPNGNAALSIDVRLPEANTLERPVGLGGGTCRSGKWTARPQVLPYCTYLTRGNPCVQVIQHPVDDNASNRDVEPKRECPTSDFLVTLEPSAPGPV